MKRKYQSRDREAQAPSAEILPPSLLDTWSAIDMARAINAEDSKSHRAVKQALPHIARAIDAIAGVAGQAADV